MRKFDKRKYDVVPIGRSSIDLYSSDIGAPFEEITGFSAFVGGSSTNIAVGASRLGMSTALITAVGDDKVADFILHNLNLEKVDTHFIPRIPHGRTSAVILGIEPPDNFPLVYYRANAADWHISKACIDDLQLSNTKSIIISGTALARDPSRSTCFYAADEARKLGTLVCLDLDFRIDQWTTVQEYQEVITSILGKVDIIIGTEEEAIVASRSESGKITIENQQISAPTVSGDLDQAVNELLQYGIGEIIIKKGKKGASSYSGNKRTDVPGYKVQVLNVLGAGDAFAAGFLYGYLQDWNMEQSLMFANACGAILVTKHGCSNFSPTLQEVQIFMSSHELREENL